jgi:uncharacterized tellurite resistance protein B-like protein
MDAQAANLLDALTDPEIDALVEVMLLAACADGVLDYAEVSELKRNLRRIDENWFSQVDLDERIERAKVRIAAESRDARLAKLRTMLPWPEQRAFALKLAARIVKADGQILAQERDLITQAAEALGVRDEIVTDFIR